MSRRRWAVARNSCGIPFIFTDSDSNGSSARPKDTLDCTERSARLGALFAKQSRCSAQQHWRQSATASRPELARKSLVVVGKQLSFLLIVV